MMIPMFFGYAYTVSNSLTLNFLPEELRLTNSPNFALNISNDFLAHFLPLSEK